MDRRGFLRGLVGGVAVASAVRTWPFRVFFFPQEIVINQGVETYTLDQLNSITTEYIVPKLPDWIFHPTPIMQYMRRRDSNPMSVIYNILYFILSPLLFTIPIFTIFVGIPILLFGLPELLWRTCRRMLFPGAIKPIPATPPTIIVSPFPKRPYKPRPKRSKMAGIRRNRAILDVARGGDHA